MKLCLVVAMAVMAAALKIPLKANFISRTLYKTAIVAASAGLCFPIMPNEALAFGPVDVALTMNGYKPVELCNGKVRALLLMVDATITPIFIYIPTFPSTYMHLLI